MLSSLPSHLQVVLNVDPNPEVCTFLNGVQLAPAACVPLRPSDTLAIGAKGQAAPPAAFRVKLRHVSLRGQPLYRGKDGPSNGAGSREEGFVTA